MSRIANCQLRSMIMNSRYSKLTSAWEKKRCDSTGCLHFLLKMTATACWNVFWLKWGSILWALNIITLLCEATYTVLVTDPQQPLKHYECVAHCVQPVTFLMILTSSSSRTASASSALLSPLLINPVSFEILKLSVGIIQIPKVWNSYEEAVEDTH